MSGQNSNLQLAPSPAWWCCFATVLLVFLMSSRALFPAVEGHYEVREIKPHVFVWIADDVLEQEGDPEFNRAANAGFIIADDCVVVVDTTNTPFNARALLYEIRKRSNLPVRFVINTSSSPDVMLGNEAFEDFTPTFLSTPSAATAMRRYRDELSSRMDNNWRLAATMRGVHPTAPNKTFEGETTLPVRGQPIQVIDLADNATQGDAAVFLPQSKVVFLGDVFENQYIPQMDSGSIRHWIQTLRRVETWNADVYVPGHGEPGGKPQVEHFRQWLEWLSSQVQLRIRQGKTLEQVQEEMIPFQNLHWHAPELESKAVTAVFQQLTRGQKRASAFTQAPPP